MGEKRKAYTILARNPEGTEDIGIDGKITLRCL
jgi:hypothetical protein